MSTPATQTEPVVDEAAELDRILRGGLLRTVFQPIVDIDTGEIAGVEALVRGPAGSPLEQPVALFPAAARVDRTIELDWACRHAALAVVAEVGLPPGCYLGLNAEPTALTMAPPASTAALLRRLDATPVVIEITEREVIADPAELLRTVDWARGHGFRVALDDVGVDPDVLALLPVIAPDVIKLDMQLVRARPSAEVAAIVAAVHAEAERSGATVVAEGVATERHRAMARAFGAALGQGSLFGAPQRLVRTLATAPRADRELARARTVHTPTPTPFEVAARGDVRVGTKGLLIEISKHLERVAAAEGASCMILSTFQHARHFTPATARRYADLAGRVTFAAALGERMPRTPVAGVRGAGVASDDPLLGEWDVVVIGARSSAALVAHDLGDTGPDHDRRFTFAMTYDVGTVARMAGSMLSRLAGR